MKKREEPGRGAYVRKVQERTQRYAKELLKENETLRGLFTSLEKEKAQLESSVTTMRAELDRHRSEYGRLQGELAAILERHQRHTEEYVLVEEQNAKLANLYVATFRLHETADRAEVLTTIQEIIINLIGSEEHAVFGLGGDGASLGLLASMGIDRARFESIPGGRGILGRVLKTGEAFWARDGVASHGATVEEEHLTVGVPLSLEGKVIGVIAIFRLLPQKGALDTADRELIELLATQAATALAFTELHAQRRAPRHG
jgi:GAF domain-containing protein